MKKTFDKMTKSEAINFIFNAVRFWGRTNHNRLVELAFALCVRWSDANPNQREIEGCELSDDNFNDGCVYGISIEDETYIFPEYREAYEEYIMNQILK